MDFRAPYLAGNLIWKTRIPERLERLWRCLLAHHLDHLRSRDKAGIRKSLPVSLPSDQIWALPPSTNSSIPVMKLESSDARNNATFATSSGSPMRPIGMVDTIRAMTSEDCRLASGVLIGPGLTTFERIRRSFKSVVQVRTNERSAALLAA